MLKVEVLGSGCPRCKQTIKILEMALQELGVNVPVEKVQDIEEIVNRG
ncbi:MAG: thioredoxin family protein, partial [Fervidobacterium pennivorans]